MKIFAIGDIHGCLDELTEMFAIIDGRANKDDLIVCIGDYIDRGPDSKGVVDLLIERQRNHPVKMVCLMGNHEDMLIDAVAHGLGAVAFWQMSNGAGTTVNSYGGTTENISDEHWDFYNNLPLYLLVEGFVFVHAGIDPSLKVEDQNPQTLIWDRAFNDYDGVYTGDYTVVHGHTPQQIVGVKSNKYNIDTGCVFGGKLTCIEIDTADKAVQFHFVQRKQ